MSLAFQAATVSVADDVGYGSVRLHVDPNDARMRWFGKKMRTDANFRIAGGDGRREIVAEPPSDPPQRLLEVADLFVFVAGRALPPESCRAKSRYEEMYRMCRPRLGVMTYNPELRMQNRIPASILDRRHEAICGSRSTVKAQIELPPGACYWVRRLAGDGEEAPCVVMQLPSGSAAPLLQAPANIDIRFGPFAVGNHVLIGCLFRLPGVPQTFTTFLNGFAGQKNSPISSLAAGAPLFMLLREGDRSVGELPFPGGHGAFWAPLAKYVEALTPDREEAHSGALTAFKLSPEEMWDAL